MKTKKVPRKDQKVGYVVYWGRGNNRIPKIIRALGRKLMSVTKGGASFDIAIEHPKRLQGYHREAFYKKEDAQKEMIRLMTLQLMYELKELAALERLGNRHRRYASRLRTYIAIEEARMENGE